MSSVVYSSASVRGALAARLADYAELARPKISLLVLATVFAAGFIARWGYPDLTALLSAVIGTGLVAASGSALNQWIERRSDRLMARTADRPLPAGRIRAGEVLFFACGTLIAGLVLLVVATNLWAAIWAVVSWIVYVVVYTPLKRRSSLNTAVGAASGALPVVIGWTAVGGLADVRLAALAGLVFLWQFPHFMAIAWLYRKQYAAAGLKMLSVVDPTGRRAGVQAVLGAMAVLSLSLLPLLAAPGAWVYLLGAFVLGVGQLVCAWRFCLQLSDDSARWLLRASLVYLPAVLLLFMFML